MMVDNFHHLRGILCRHNNNNNNNHNHNHNWRISLIPGCFKPRRFRQMSNYPTFLSHLLGILIKNSRYNNNSNNNNLFR